MQNLLNFFIIIVFTFTFFGCTNTSITTYKDSKYDDVKYATFVASVIVDSLEDRQYLEAKLCKEIKFLTFGTKDLTAKIENFDITCMLGWDLFPPTSEYNPEDKRTILASLKVSALLEVNQKSSIVRYQETSYIKPAYLHVEDSDTEVHALEKLNPSHAHSNSWLDEYEITLFDVKTGDKVLVGSSQTKGDKFVGNGINTLFLDSLANAVVKQLFENGLLKQHKPTDQ